jgi:hypothetical protein
MKASGIHKRRIPGLGLAFIAELFLVAPAHKYPCRGGAHPHTAGYDLFIKSQLASRD